MFISIPSVLLRSQDYDACLRFACDELSRRGIRNFIHYRLIRVVELYEPTRTMAVLIDHQRTGILLITQ
jgi:hypothetical protein